MKEKDFSHGDYVSCSISGNAVTDARISIDSDKNMFICQNVISGSRAYDTLGYSYSWNIYSPKRNGSFEEQLKHDNIKVSNLRKITKGI